MARAKLSDVGSGLAREVTIEPASNGQLIRALVDNRTIEVEPQEQPVTSGRVVIEGYRVRFHVARRGDRVFVKLGRRVFEFDVQRNGPKRKGADATSETTESIVAPMPGTVLDVRVGEGDGFEAGDAIVIIESMKMEMTLSAPHAGVVRRLHCKPGQLVEQGAVLVTLDPAPSPPQTDRAP